MSSEYLLRRRMSRRLHLLKPAETSNGGRCSEMIRAYPYGTIRRFRRQHNSHASQAFSPYLATRAGKKKLGRQKGALPRTSNEMRSMPELSIESNSLRPLDPCLRQIGADILHHLTCAGTA